MEPACLESHRADLLLADPVGEKADLDEVGHLIAGDLVASAVGQVVVVGPRLLGVGGGPLLASREGPASALVDRDEHRAVGAVEELPRRAPAKRVDHAAIVVALLHRMQAPEPVDLSHGVSCPAEDCEASK